MKTRKVYTLIETRTFSYRRPSSTTEYTGTVEELTKVFSYTLEVGNSWNRKISLKPKGIKSLVKHINMAFEEKNNGMTFVELKEK